MDASHYYGSDLTLSATGDLLLADGVEESKQRVLRRLLTCLKDYLWQPDYGAGLPARVGSTLDEAEIAALVRSQMYQERSVSHDPEPIVALQIIPNGISMKIRYTVATLDQPATLAFRIAP